MQLIKLRKIWDYAPHNAFTNLCRFQDRWYCSFREAETHASQDAKIRMLVSVDNENWESQVLLETSRTDLPDLRDPKLCVMPDNRFLLTAAATCNDAAAFTALVLRRRKVMERSHPYRRTQLLDMAHYLA